MKEIIKLTALILTVFIIFSCHKKEQTKDKIIAKVGNLYITEDYFNEKIMESGEFDYLKTKIGKKQFLDVLINERLLKMAAENSDIPNSDEYKQQVKKLEEEMKKRLEEYKEIILTKMYLEKIKSERLGVDQKEIEDYIKNHPSMVSFEQVITTDYETAQTALNMLKSGKNIENIAQVFKERNDVVVNKIPPVLWGELMDELNDIVFKLRVNEIGGIIKTKLGYHVIRKKSQSNANFADEKIRNRVSRILEKKKFDQYLSELEKKYSVEVIDENYK